MCTRRGLNIAGQINRPKLRQMLTDAFRTDAEFGAFCLDYFPTTYMLFSQGMNREEKLNLLLERESPYSIAIQIPNTNGDLPQLCSVNTCSYISDEASQSRLSGTTARKVVVRIAIVLAVISVIISATIMRHPRAITKTITQEVSGNLASLLSEPSSAEVWDLRTGRFLGRTPTQMDKDTLPRQVCLKKPGWHDEVVILRAEKIPFDPVMLRPTNSSLVAACNVPIPILH